MELQTTATPALDWSGEGLALGLFETDITDSATLQGDWASLDQKLDGSLSELIAETEFKAKPNTSVVIRLGKTAPVRKVILIGLGQPKNLKLDTLRRAAATGIRAANKQKLKQLALSLPLGLLDATQATQAMAEGIELSLYRDTRFKSETDDHPSVSQITLLELGDQGGALRGAIAQAHTICSGVILARQLVAAPANYVTPVTMAETAQELAQTYGLELEILEQADCEAQNMGAYLGVARASDIPPKFLHLTYKPSGTPKRKLAIVGKGLTFDCGGLNIKVGASSIEMMKTDMGGAAATLGAAKAIGQLKPDVEVHFISAVTENMISGRAMHPGDILTASNGKTIEVNNTDAEGRLTLADALVFTEKLEVDAIVDLATLTGACLVALGNEIAGLWSTEDTLADQILEAADQAGEKLWRMPLEEKYFEGMKSVVADMKNTGPRAGGSITAALFLKQFIKDTAWAHIDLAGPIWTDKENGYNPPGATGYAVRTLVNWVMSA
jgi:leucyl aminopeptidase